MSEFVRSFFTPDDYGQVNEFSNYSTPAFTFQGEITSKEHTGKSWQWMTTNISPPMVREPKMGRTRRSPQYRKSNQAFTKKLSGCGLKLKTCSISRKLFRELRNRTIDKAVMTLRGRKAMTPAPGIPPITAAFSTGVLSD